MRVDLPTELVALLAARWGSQRVQSSADRGGNVVCHLTGGADDAYLRITTTAKRSLRLAAGALDWQHHLHQCGAPVAEPLISSDGFWIETARSGETTFVATATRCVRGRPLDFANLSDIEAWAQTIGIVHAASERYSPSSVATRMGPIDGELPTLTDLWMEIQTVIAGDSLLQSQHVRGAEWLSGLTESTILTHGDVRPENALVVGERVILLDFDEPTSAWPGYDLGRMMMDDEAAPPSAPRTHLSTMRAGYGRTRPDYLWSSDEIARFLGIRALLMYGWSLQDRSGTGTIWMRRLRAIVERPLDRLR